MPKWLFAALICALGFNAYADPAPSCDDDSNSYRLFDLLDPEAAPEVRQEQLHLLKERVHCPDAARSLGLLYRHGADLPGNPVERDDTQAHELLLRSAQLGNLLTFADLAEMALRNGQAREAMKWTQVYLYLLRHRAAYDRTDDSFERSGYNADLLVRADREWRAARPRLDRALISADLNEYLKGESGVAILAAIDATDARAVKASSRGPAADEPRIRAVHLCSGVISRTAGYASYLVQIMPDGSVGRVVLENFSPTPKIGAALRSCASVYEYYPHAQKAPMEVRIPVFFGYPNVAKISK
ncbi:hypothetical protein [Lysobacter terrae]